MTVKTIAILTASSLGLLRAQEPKLGLGGIFEIGSTRSHSTSQLFPNSRIGTNATDLYWGLDLDIRTYILDPRFISLSLEPSFHRGSGRVDELENHNGDTGGNFYLDFLKESSYPFRFHFIDHSLRYEFERLNSVDVARRSIGFDWTLRKPRRPPVFVNYDDSHYDYRFTLSPATVTRTRNLLAATQVNYAGWNTNAAYSRQSSTEAFTGLGTGTDLLRADAHKDVWPGSRLSINSLFEVLHFSNQAGTARQDLPFTSIRTDLRTRHSEKLSTTLFHQYYRTSGAETTVTPGGVAVPQQQSQTGSAGFNEVGGQVSYHPFSSVTLGASTNATWVSEPIRTVEFVAHTTNVSASVGWQRKFKFLQTRGAYLRGIVYAASSAGQSRQVPLDSANAGISAGDPRTLMISADANYSHRPELFEIGGRFTQRNGTAALETGAARIFRLRGAAGINEFDYLTLRGRERFRTRTYSASISRSIFSVMLSRNANIGLRSLLVGPEAIGLPNVFVTLPVDILTNAPLLSTTGVYTLGAFTVRTRRRFEFEARYLRQHVLLPNSPSILVRDYEAYINYRFGKFIITVGGLYYGDATQDVSHRLRSYFFFRVSRPFRILGL